MRMISRPTLYFSTNCDFYKITNQPVRTHFLQREYNASYKGSSLISFAAVMFISLMSKWAGSQEKPRFVTPPAPGSLIRYKNHDEVALCVHDFAFVHISHMHISEIRSDPNNKFASNAKKFWVSKILLWIDALVEEWSLSMIHDCMWIFCKKNQQTS